MQIINTLLVKEEIKKRKYQVSLLRKFFIVNILIINEEYRQKVQHMSITKALNTQVPFMILTDIKIHKNMHYKLIYALRCLHSTELADTKHSEKHKLHIPVLYLGCSDSVSCSEGGVGKTGRAVRGLTGVGTTGTDAGGVGMGVWYV